MNAERWNRIESLFASALERDPAHRASFLDRECGSDKELRKEVEDLLAHQQPTGRFIPTLIHDAARLIPKHDPFSGSEGRFIPGTVLASRYRIIGLLGRGGMGEVYRADDLKLAQPVALKFLPENLARDHSMLERFHREVRIARQISHPNVCRMFDIGEGDGQHFLSMEYIDGEDLATLLRRIGRLPADKAVEIAQQLCAGLAAAHEEGVLHRDLKPANVMIDGRGRAKITDFGLAGLAGDFQGHEVRAGTPAYMAPEQLSGSEVTAKSDIYSLGLLLYEIFTGKKAFEAATLEELIKLRESSTPPSISNYVKEIDPLVERVILRCLERDPRDRLSSVAQVAAALPGGDPLAAAIAAGETPSPEMVAAAPKEGALRPAAAIACLAGIIIMLAFFVLAAGKTAIQNRMPLDKPPAVLAERASGIINRFGYTEPPVDKAYWFRFDDGYREDPKMRDSLESNLEKLATGQPPVIAFRYRQSPRYMEPFNGESVWFTDPPMQVSNMVNLTLDTRGRLIEFNAVPPQVDGGQQQTTQFDWAVLFSEAGLDIADFTSSNSTWSPPVCYDARAAWEGACADNPDIPVRVEAAVYRGKPVYFQIVYPWDKPLRQEEAAGLSGRNVAGILLTVTFIAGLIGAVLLARRNLKLGRSDRKGAFKIVIVAFCCVMIGSLLSADHVPTLGGEMSVIYEAASWSLVVVALLWVFYVALEPYVRRRWPKLIISWSRLLSGGWRDPMVGRDILVGGFMGMGHTLAIHLSLFLPRLLGLPSSPGLSFAPDADGLTSSIAFVSTILPRAIFSGMGFLFLILLFYVLFKRQWLAASALWLMIFVVNGLGFYSGDPWIAWISPVVIATITVITVVRFGLLSVVAFQFFFFLSAQRALTTDLSKWYAGETIFAVAVLLGISFYSFYTSLAGQPLFRSGMLQD